MCSELILRQAASLQVRRVPAATSIISILRSAENQRVPFPKFVIILKNYKVCFCGSDFKRECEGIIWMNLKALHLLVRHNAMTTLQ